VFPFQNMRGDPEQEYFADGVVEEIITAQKPSLPVGGKQKTWRWPGPFLLCDDHYDPGSLLVAADPDPTNGRPSPAPALTIAPPATMIPVATTALPAPMVATTAIAAPVVATPAIVHSAASE